MPLATGNGIKIPFDAETADFIAGSNKVIAELDRVKQATKANSKLIEDQARREQSAVKKSTSSWTEFRSMYSTVLDVVRVGQAVWNETAGKFVDNAVAVGNLARSMGTTTEEASRLKEVADDVGIGIDALRTSLKLAAKDGFSPTIESIAAMADEYNQLAPGVERTQFLLDRFGKSGEEMGKLLEKGGDGIRNMAAAMDEGLIVTEEAYKQARAYQVSVDALKDSWDALTYKAAPPLVNAMKGVIDVTRDAARRDEILAEQGLNFVSASQKQRDAALAQAQAEREEADAATLAARTAGDAAGAFESEAEKAKRLADEAKAAEEQVRAISEANKSFIGVLNDVDGAMDTYYGGLAEAKKQLDEGKISTEEHRAKVKELAEAYKQAQADIVLSIVEMKLAQDGWTDAELNAYLNIGVAQGKWTDDTVKAAQGAITQANKLVGAYQNLGENAYHTGERAEDATEGIDALEDSQSDLATGLNKEGNPAVAELKKNILGLPPSGTSWQYNFNITTKGKVPSLPSLPGANATTNPYGQGHEGSGTGGAGGGGYAAGGVLGGGWNVVGDAPGGAHTPYTEAIYNGVVFSAAETRKLKMAGVLDGAMPYYDPDNGPGGSLPGLGYTPPPKKKRRSSSTRAGSPVSSGGGSSSGGGGDSAADVVAETAAQTAGLVSNELNQSTMQAIHASAVAAASAQQQSNLIAQTNKLLEELISVTGNPLQNAKLNFEQQSRAT